MKRFLLTSLIAGLILASSASAAAAKSSSGGSYVPAGESAAAQYTEDVPTAGGDTPDHGVHDSTGATVIPKTTLDQLSRSSTGAAAARLAEALAPRASRADAGSGRPRSGQTGAGHEDPTAAIQAGKTFSGGGDGFGVGFIILLVAILLLVSGAGIIRLRRHR